MADEDVDNEDWTKPVDSYEGQLDSHFLSSRFRQKPGSPAAAAASSSFTNANSNNSISNTMELYGNTNSNSNSNNSTTKRKAFLSGSGETKGDHPHTIVHIDLDCFYAQVEMVRNPALRTKPLGIQQKYLLVTCNYVARAQGVTKLMRVSEALQRCPDLVIVSGEDLTHYREMSYRITELLHQFSPLVERLGFDENFVDVTHLIAQRSQETEAIGHVYGESSERTDRGAALAPTCSCGCRQRLVIGSHIAKEMREALRTQLGLTSCAGVAHNKLLAKLVGSVHKPDDQTMLLPHEAGKLMGTLSKVTHVPGIGHSTGKKLALLGITTLNELTEAPLALLKGEFGYQTAYTMQRLCQGHDDTPVVQSGPPQSISDEDSFKKCGTLPEAQAKIKTLLICLLQRLRKDGRQPVTLRLSVRKYSKVHKWTRESRQCGLPSGILQGLQLDEAAATSKLLGLCLSLFQKMVDTSKPFHLTLISVCFAKFQSPVATASDISRFFSQKSAQKQKDDSTVDESDTVTEPHGSSQSDVCSSATPFAAGGTGTHKTLSSGKLAYPDRLSLNPVTEKTPHSTVSSYQNTSSSQDRPMVPETTDRTGKVECDGMDVNESMHSGANSKEKDKSGTDTDVSPRKNVSFFAQKSDPGAAPHTFVRKDNKIGRTEMEDMGAASSKEDEVLVSKKSSKATTLKKEASIAVPPNIDQSVFAELPTEVQQELLNEWRNAVAKQPDETQDVADPHGSQMDQLPGIDNSVFRELPPDIQDDVLRQYKHKRTSSEMSPHRGLQVKRPRTVKSPSKKTACKSKSITDFFKK